MENQTVLDLKAFLPTKDYALSVQFYRDLGFTVNFSNEQMTELQVGQFRFLLTNFYNKDHAENFALQLLVDDVHSWWKHIVDSGLTDKYPTVMSKAPEMQPWGLRILFISDPSGVLWHIADFGADANVNEWDGDADISLEADDNEPIN